MNVHHLLFNWDSLIQDILLIVNWCKMTHHIPRCVKVCTKWKVYICTNSLMSSINLGTLLIVIMITRARMDLAEWVQILCRIRSCATTKVLFLFSFSFPDGLVWDRFPPCNVRSSVGFPGYMCTREGRIMSQKFTNRFNKGVFTKDCY